MVLEPKSALAKPKRGHIPAPRAPAAARGRDRASTTALATAAMAAVVVATVGLPSSSPAAIDRTEAACALTLNKDLLKAATARNKALGGCLKDFAKGKNSDLAACIAADPKGKIAKAQAKAQAHEDSKCAGPPVLIASGAASNMQAAADGAALSVEVLFGPDLNAAALKEADGKAAAKCQQKVVKRVTKCGELRLKAFNKCAKTALKNGGGLPEVESCVAALSADPKLDKACAKTSADLEKKCLARGVPLSSVFPHCDTSSPQAAADCFDLPLRCQLCQDLNSAARLNADCDGFDDGAANGSCAYGELLALSYNVAGLPDIYSGSIPSLYTPIISPLLNAYDLVLVQESWQTPDDNPLAPLRVYHELLVADADHPYLSIPAPHPFGGDPTRPSALVSDGLNRFSTLPFGDLTRVAWAGCHESSADCLAFKGFSVARTELAAGLSVDVYNLHMEAGGDVEDELLRDAGLTQMLDHMAAFSAGRAVIMGGDFNLHTDEEPDSSQFQRLVAEGGLSDVCAALACPEGGRIDKFLFRSGGGVTITPTSWNFETARFVVPWTGDPLSDHDALAVNFRWSAGP